MNGLSAFLHTSSKTGNNFHDEYFEFRDGYGLRYSYQHSPDPKEDAANRNHAYLQYHGNRYQGNRFFDSFYKFVDEVCDRFKDIKERVFSPAEMRRHVESVREYQAQLKGFKEDVKKDVDKEYGRISELGRFEFKTGGQKSFDLFVDALDRVKDGRMVPDGRMHVKTDDSTIVAKSMAYDRLCSAVRSYSREYLADHIVSNQKAVFERDGLMDFVKSYLNASRGWTFDGSQESMRDFSFNFARMARLDGWSVKDIDDALRNEYNRYALEYDFNASRFIRDGVDVEICRPFHEAAEGWKKEGVLNADTARSFSINGYNQDCKDLMESRRQGVKTLLSIGYGREGRPDGDMVRLGYELAEAGVKDPSLFRAVSLAVSSGDYPGRTGQVKGFGQGGRLAEDVHGKLVSGALEYLQENVDRKKDVHAGFAEFVGSATGHRVAAMPSPVDVFARDLAMVAHMVKNDSGRSDRLQDFLCRVFYQNGLSIGGDGNFIDDLRHAARVIYGNGEVDNISKVTELRGYYGEFIDRGRSLLRTGFSEVEQASVRKETTVSTQPEAAVQSSSGEVNPSYLPAGTVYTVLPEDLAKGVVPPGTEIGFTEDGQKYLKTFSQNRSVPEDGLVLVKNSAYVNLYDVCTRKQFDSMYKVGEDGLANKVQVKQDLKPGLRKGKGVS